MGTSIIYYTCISGARSWPGEGGCSCWFRLSSRQRQHNWLGVPSSKSRTSRERFSTLIDERIQLAAVRAQRTRLLCTPSSTLVNSTRYYRSSFAAICGNQWPAQASVHDLCSTSLHNSTEVALSSCTSKGDQSIRIPTPSSAPSTNSMQ